MVKILHDVAHAFSRKSGNDPFRRGSHAWLLTYLLAEVNGIDIGEAALDL